jgi:hypothetical protein
MNEVPEWKLNLYEVVGAAQRCLDMRLILPCLILIYSGIDVAGSMTSIDGRATGATFKKWVQDYLLKACSIPATPADLYAARCGLVHTLRADSDLSRNGRARDVMYSHGNVDKDHLNKSAVLIGFKNIVAVHIDDLSAGFSAGISVFFNDIGFNPEMMKRVVANSKSSFSRKLKKEDLARAIQQLPTEIEAVEIQQTGIRK